MKIPHNIEAEKAVLGSIILRPTGLLEVAGTITKDSFFDSKNAKIFECFLKLQKEGKPIDLLSLSNEFKEVGNVYLAKLVSNVPSSTNIKYYAEVVAKQKTLRDVIEMGNKITEIGMNEDFENLPIVLSELQKNLIAKKINSNDIYKSFEDFDQRTREYQDKIKQGVDLMGLSCGFEKVDKVIDGLRKGHFWVIGGFTNLGKTTLALNITKDLIKQNKRVVFYSLEMTDIDILSRLLGIFCEENGLTIIKGYSNNKDKVNEYRQKIINTNFTIKTGMSELSEIMMSMYEENLKNPVDLFVVDYLQNMKVKGAKSEYDTITTSAVELQLNAQRLGIPIIALSQISNEGAKNNEYQLVSSFKGSGAIGASADLAMEIKIGEKSNEERIEKLKNGQKVLMRLVINKNRHGSVGYIDLLFDGKTGIFSEDVVDF